MSNRRNNTRGVITQPKMGRNATPISYAEMGEDVPRTTIQILRGEEPEQVKVMKCRLCGRSGGTLRNVGDKHDPLYEHLPNCQKKCHYCGKSSGKLVNTGTASEPVWEHDPLCRAGVKEELKKAETPGGK